MKILDIFKKKNTQNDFDDIKHKSIVELEKITNNIIDNIKNNPELNVYTFTYPRTYLSNIIFFDDFKAESYIINNIYLKLNRHFELETYEQSRDFTTTLIVKTKGIEL